MRESGVGDKGWWLDEQGFVFSFMLYNDNSLSSGIE